MRRHDDLRLSRRKLLAFGALSTGFALAACSNGEYAATASPTRTGAATTAAAASGTRRPASGTAKVAGPGATPAAQLTTGPTEKVILTYYQFGGATDPQTLILPHATQVFNQKLAPVSVQALFTPGGTQLQVKLETMIAGGTPPDASAIPPTIITPLYSKGILTDLTPYIKQAGAAFAPEDFYEQTLTRVIIAGKQWAIPLQMGIHTLIYNKDLFDKAGVAYPNENWSWDREFVEAAQKLTKGSGPTKQYGTLLPTREIVIWANGGDVLSQDGTKCLLDQPAADEAIQFLSDLRFKYQVAPLQSDMTGTSPTDLFLSGRVAMDIDLSAQVSTFERSKPKFAWDIDRVPKGKVTRATIVQGPSVGIIQAAKHRDLTWDWVSWLTGKEIQAYEATVAHMAMARKSADVAFLKLPPPPQHRAEIIDSVPFARQLEYVQNFIQIDDVTNKHLDDVLVSNSKTAQAAMQAACQQITPLLGKG